MYIVSQSGNKVANMEFCILLTPEQSRDEFEDEYRIIVNGYKYASYKDKTMAELCFDCVLRAIHNGDKIMNLKKTEENYEKQREKMEKCSG